MQPVRAERLAALRIGMAGCLLIDILTSYRAGLHDFFGQGGLGGAQTFAYYGEAPRLNWSLLRGFGDSLLSALALTIWTALTLWLVVDFLTRLSGRWGGVEQEVTEKTENTAPLFPLFAPVELFWIAAGLFVVLGVWSRSIKTPGDATWIIPLGMASVAGLFLFLELYKRRRRTHRDGRLGLFLANLCVALALAGLSLILPFQSWSEEKTPSLGHRLLLSWQDDCCLLNSAFAAWAASAFLLCAGCWTRAMATLTWALSMSFANANPNIDNAGDTIRAITLVYLMLSPCGAAWSVDALLLRRRHAGQHPCPTYVWPWPLRLLFIQLVLMYFMNGLYKATGANWLEGDSLYYVLCDITLTRFSIADLPIPFVLVQVMTWLVVTWELTFPVLVLFARTRWLALLFGAAFHLGIFATMELGGFVPYVLCLYLPLLPWDRWLGGFKQ
jgi:hypothetical protein